MWDKENNHWKILILAYLYHHIQETFNNIINQYYMFWTLRAEICTINWWYFEKFVVLDGNIYANSNTLQHNRMDSIKIINTEKLPTKERLHH